MNNALSTYVQMFCGICKKYDCQMHGIKPFDALPTASAGFVATTSVVCGPQCYLVPKADGKAAAGVDVLSPLQGSLLDKVV